MVRKHWHKSQLRKTKYFVTLFRLVGGGGLFEPPSGKIVITPTPKEVWRSNFLTFPKIYLGTFWYNYHVHVINHVALGTSFWHICFGKFKKVVIFCFKIAFLHLQCCLLLKWSLLGTSFWITSKCFNIKYLGGRGGVKFVTFLLWQICCSIFQITLLKSSVWVINISLILFLYTLSFFSFESCFKL